MEHDVRPWGEYWVLEDKETHKVKRIIVRINRYFMKCVLLFCRVIKRFS